MRRPGLRYLLYILVMGALCALASPVLAQDAGNSIEEESELDLFDDDVERKKSGWSRLQVSAGVVYLDADGVFAASLPEREPVTIINFDRVGLEETDASHWFSLTWRSANSRWGAWFCNWRYDVSGSRAWETELSIPDYPTVPVGAEVKTNFDANWYVLEATYSFVQTDSVNAGIGIGLHTVDLDTELILQIDIGDGQFEIVQGDLDTLAPLPNVLGYVYWKPAPRWHMVARLGWFGLEYDKYKGQMTNAHYMLSYEVSERFSLGAAYQFVSLDVDVEEERYTQLYDIDFDGPMAFLRFRF